MPSKSHKQHNFMAMCAHTPGAAKGKCPPKSVASEYVHADKGKKFTGRTGRNKKLVDMVSRKR